MATNLAYKHTSDSGEVMRRLRHIIQSNSVLKGDFILASGKRSPVFWDMKKTLFDPNGIRYVGEALYPLVRERGVHFVGGLEMGAVPVALAVARESRADHEVKAFFVRKEPKGHGTNQWIDGHLPQNAPAIVLDDVTTTGGSVLQAVAKVRERGCKVDTVITIVDRLEGAEQNLAQHGLQLVALFTKEDFNL